MALESTIVPIPSEVIIPPAAYLAYTQGQMSLLGIVLAGTAGSWVGAALMYWGARLVGRPLILSFGRYVGISSTKIDMAERWAARYGSAGAFFSPPLPPLCPPIGISRGGLPLGFRVYGPASPAGSCVWLLGCCSVPQKPHP